MPWACFLIGVVLLALPVVGLSSGELYFFGRDNVIRIIDRESESYLYWATATIYVFSGIVTLLYGLKELRAE